MNNMREVVNPYIAGRPVNGKEMFFGREHEFNIVLQNLRGKHSDNSLILYGQQRTGKTSILYQLAGRLGDNYICVFINLESFPLQTIESFLWGIARTMVSSLRQVYHIDVVIPDQTQFHTDPEGCFEHKFLRQILSTVGNRRLLLMFDEATRLQGRSFSHYLLHLMQDYPQLNFLFALSIGVEAVKKEYVPLLHSSLYQEISFLDWEAAETLITEPVKDCYEVESIAIDRILELTFRHPFYTQLLCHTLFNYWQRESISQIRVRDVELCLDEAVERGTLQLQVIWEESTPGEKAILAGMAAATSTSRRGRSVKWEEINRVWRKLGIAIPRAVEAQAVKRLKARRVLQENHEPYAFTVDLLRLWIQKHQRLELVKEENFDVMKHWRVDRPGRPGYEPIKHKWLPWVATSAVILLALAVFLLFGQDVILGILAAPTPVVDTLDPTTEPMLSLAQQSTKSFGPVKGELQHGDGSTVPTYPSNLDVKDFIVETRFYNPYDLSRGRWDYGFFFRYTANDYFRLIVDSAAHWSFLRGQSTRLREGSLSNINVSSRGSNVLKLIAAAEKGYFFVNGSYVTTLDLSGLMSAGDVEVATAIVQGERISDQVTQFDSFTVWSLPVGLFDQAPSGSNYGQFDLPRGIATAPDGSFYVVDTGNMRIQHFGKDGKFLQAFGSLGTDKGQFIGLDLNGTHLYGSGPGGIAVDTEGDIYVADTWNHRIQKFDKLGTFLDSWGSYADLNPAPTPSLTPTQLPLEINKSFYGPRDVAVSHTGDVYITDTGNKRVLVFDKDGNPLRQIAKGAEPNMNSSDGPDQLNEPMGLALDTRDNVYIADTYNHRISVFDKMGQPLRRWAIPEGGWSKDTIFLEPHIALDSKDNVYVTDPTKATVYKFDNLGNLIGSKNSTERISLTRPTGLTITQDGEVVVVDTEQDAVVNLGRIP